jgi:hypothetical protein
MYRRFGGTSFLHLRVEEYATREKAMYVREKKKEPG